MCDETILRGAMPRAHDRAFCGHITPVPTAGSPSATTGSSPSSWVMDPGDITVFDVVPRDG
jgi:hypothetical protein